jgi:hypothetical protein
LATQEQIIWDKDVLFLISNFRRDLNIVCILLGIYLASDCDVPMFRNHLPSSKTGCRVFYTQPLKMELTETSANHNLTPGKYPREYIQRCIIIFGIIVFVAGWLAGRCVN